MTSREDEASDVDRREMVCLGGGELTSIDGMEDVEGLCDVGPRRVVVGGEAGRNGQRGRQTSRST